MSVVAIVLLAAAAVLLVAVESSRFRVPAVHRRRPTAAPRRLPRRRRGRAKLEVVRPEHEEFARSVERDLAALPTIDEHDVNRH